MSIALNIGVACGALAGGATFASMGLKHVPSGTSDASYFAKMIGFSFVAAGLVGASTYLFAAAPMTAKVLVGSFAVGAGLVVKFAS